MKRKSHERTVGTLIAQSVIGWALTLCATACFAGGLRYVIHDLVEKLRG